MDRFPKITACEIKSIGHQAQSWITSLKDLKEAVIKNSFNFFRTQRGRVEKFYHNSAERKTGII